MIFYSVVQFFSKPKKWLGDVKIYKNLIDYFDVYSLSSLFSYFIYVFTFFYSRIYLKIPQVNQMSGLTGSELVKLYYILYLYFEANR